MKQPAVLVVTKDPSRLATKAQAMQKAILFVTGTALRKSAGADEAGPLGDIGQPECLIYADRIEVPARNTIDTPTEWTDGEMQQRWRLALHEAGHCVAATLAGGCTGAGIQRMAGEWRGIAYDECPEGVSRYGIALAGCAAESLGPSPSNFAFDGSDFKFARNELRASGMPEGDILDKIGGDMATMADEFAERWAKGIRALAEALCTRGWLNEDQIRGILGQGQALLSKSCRPTTPGRWEDVRAFGQPLAKATGNFDKLDAELTLVGAQQALDDATEPAQIARLEAQRNRADTNVAALRRSKP